MHRTRTFAYVVLIEGELVLILDDGEVILKRCIAYSTFNGAPNPSG